MNPAAEPLTALGLVLRPPTLADAEGLYRLWTHGGGLVTWFQLRDNPRGTFTWGQTFQSGLYSAAGAPKLSLAAYAMPIWVVKRRGSTVTVWGRVRPPADGQAITIAAGRLNVPAILRALDRYPYGCTEQIASRAMPLVYLNEVALQAGLAGDPDVHDRVEKAIAGVLANKQVALGPLGVEAGIFAFLILVASSSAVAELFGRPTANRLVLIGFAPLILSMGLAYLVLQLVDAEHPFGELCFCSGVALEPANTWALRIPISSAGRAAVQMRDTR